MPLSTVITRFAPSPTGYLHVGGARTALFNWLLARHLGGTFLLRIEDTDLARSTEDATTQLLSDLRWLGLNWDNAELVYQSKRLPIYNALIDKLIAEGKAYEAWESTTELDAMRHQAQRAKRPFLYRRQTYPAEMLARFNDEGRKPVIRFAMPVKEYRFHDITLGKDVVQSPYEVQDFIIRKTDGMPTYHFAVVVDDAEMGITHVLRGLEHLLNTMNHIALQEALGYPRPIYAHLSVMLNPETGEKLSKRDRDQKIRQRTIEWMRSTKTSLAEFEARSGFAKGKLEGWISNSPPQQLDFSGQEVVMKIIGMEESELPEILIHDFRRNGYTPEVLNNFLALQGWSPGGDREQMSIGEMTELFSLDRINSANPKFNRDKLKAFQTDANARISMEELVRAMRDYLGVNPESPLNAADDATLARVLQVNAGFHIFREVDEKSQFLFLADEKIVYQPDAVDKVLRKNDGQGFAALLKACEALAAATGWKHDTLENAIKELCASENLGLGKVAQPIRVAISGSAISPPIFQSLELLGRDRTLARIDRCLALK